MIGFETSSSSVVPSLGGLADNSLLVLYHILSSIVRQLYVTS